jgi:hypothetical protein
LKRNGRLSLLLFFGLLFLASRKWTADRSVPCSVKGSCAKEGKPEHEIGKIIAQTRWKSYRSATTLCIRLVRVLSFEPKLFQLSAVGIFCVFFSFETS